MSYEEDRNYAFADWRPKGFKNGECPRCSDLDIGFRHGADWAKDYYERDLEIMMHENTEKTLIIEDKATVTKLLTQEIKLLRNEVKKLTRLKATSKETKEQ